MQLLASDGENQCMKDKSSSIGYSKTHGEKIGEKVVTLKCSEELTWLPLKIKLFTWIL